MTVHRAEPGVTREALEEAMRVLGRAFSAVKLYLPNNPQRLARLAEARQAFATLFRDGESLVLDVREQTFVWDGAVVFQDTDRGAEALPWLLYRDGIRALRLDPGFETDELERFLTIVQGVRTSNRDEDDLVTLLWVANFRCLAYRYLDTVGGDPQTGASTSAYAGTAADAPGVSFYVRGEETAAPADRHLAPPAPGTFIRMEDFDGALYFLDQREVTALQAELARAYAEDPRRSVFDSLFDLLEVGLPDLAAREAVEGIDTLLVELLTAAEYVLAAHVLREAARVARLSSTPPALADALRAMAHRLSEPRAMAQLLLAIDDSTRTPAIALLEELFRELQPSALEPLVHWLGTASASPARAAVERASLRLASAHLSELGRLLDDSQPAIVKGALRIATQLAHPATVPGLSKLLRTDEVRMRLDAVNALANIGSPGAVQALERALDDPDREVRVAVYRTIAARKHGGALPRLLGILRAKDTRATDLGEKMALFEAFGSLCGDQGVAELDGILNSKGLLGAKEPPEFRACAARALGLVGTPSALAALQRASDTRDVVVRSAVLRAMREGA